MVIPSLYKGKKVAVFGLGKAGMSAIYALHKAGAHIYAYDDNVPACKALEDEALSGVTIAPPGTYPWDTMEVLVLSPGIPLTHPMPHPVVILAKKAGCPMVCDIELLYQAVPNATYVGITGTNGKSTTTALIGHILRFAGRKVAVGGNIGIPALDLDTLGKDGIYVLELSSYQLDLVEKLPIHISVLLNITPDHLDRHGGMDGYIAAKRHIYDNQNRKDTAVIAVDDNYTRTLYATLVKENRIGYIIPVSSVQALPQGVTVKGGKIEDHITGKGQNHGLGELPRLPGQHNAQNVAAAYAACRQLGVAPEVIIAAIREFQGLAHRIQWVDEIDGVLFINDSKATNAEAASKALAAYDTVFWIAGGKAKEGGIASLVPFFPRIKHAFLIGEAQDEFAKALEGKVPFTRSQHLENAVKQAACAAREWVANKKGKQHAVVLLSPACASFDQWKNFEARGEAFCTMVKELEQAGKAQEQY